MQEFYEKAIDMVESRPLPTLEERKQMIEALNEECYQELGMFLSSRILCILGDWLLNEDLSNPNPHKARVEEYPIYSIHQEKRRMRKHVLIEDEGILSTLNYHIKNNSIRKNTSGRYRKNE